MQSSGFREIFIFVAGATPQIITETIWALSQVYPPVYPHGILIVTTALGKKRIQETLVGQGILRSLAAEHGLPDISLTEDSFVVPVGPTGELLEDITTTADNEAAGDLITMLVREKAADPRSRLHCSLAGGRKTMSFYLGSALQLFGRPWDKLYHVLVTPPAFEGHAEFYYKPKEDRVLTPPPSAPPLKVRGGRGELNTRDAEIILAELPFIRLGGKLSLQGKGFRELVREGQKEIDTAAMQPEIRVSLADHTVRVGEDVLEMVPTQLVVYVALLRQKVDHCRYPERSYCHDCTACFRTAADMTEPPSIEEMARDYRAMYGGRQFREDEFLRKRSVPDTDNIRTAMSKIDKAVKEQLSDHTLLPYLQVGRVRVYGGTRYGVRVEKGKIRVE